MTLNQWLTSTDPAAMLAALGEQADERRLLAFQRACRDQADATDGKIVWGPLGILNARSWISPSHPQVCPVIRCLWPPPMMECERVECPECKNWSIRQKESITRINCKTCNDTLFALTPLIDPRWRTPLVLDLARQVRGKDAGWYCKSCGKECGTADFWCHCGDKATRSKSDAIQPNPGAMLPLSDVLFEAGCDVPEIIDHLKCGVHGPECWVIGALLNGQ